MLHFLGCRARAALRSLSRGARRAFAEVFPRLAVAWEEAAAAAVLEGHVGRVLALAALGETRLASGADDCTVKVHGRLHCHFAKMMVQFCQV